MKGLPHSLLFFIAFVSLLAPTVRSDAEVQEQVDQLTKAIARQPQSPSLLVQRADLYRRGGHWGEAIEDLHSAKALAGPSSGYDIGMARLLEDMGRAQTALHFASRQLKREPRCTVGLELRARLHAALGMKRKAIEDYDRRLAVMARRAEPDLWLARARLQSSLGEKEAALAGIRRGLQVLGRCLSLELHALELEQELALFEDALKRVDRLSAGSARQESWHARRGHIHLRAGRKLEALRCFKRALSSIEALRPNRRDTELIRNLERDLRKRIEELQ